MAAGRGWSFGRKISGRQGRAQQRGAAGHLRVLHRQFAMTRANGHASDEVFIRADRIRVAARREVAAYTEGVIGPAIAQALGGAAKDTDSRIAALEARIERLETALSEFKYKGAWQEGAAY